jgi:sarcosine oxidase
MKGIAQIYDTVVIGLGGAGSSALYHASKTGRKVLGVERFDLRHTFGSSHGDTRIIRQSYFEGEYYVPFVKRAYDLWDDLEKRSGEKLFLKSGCLNISTKKDNLVGLCKAVSEKHNLSYNLLSNSEVNSKYPFFSIPDKYECLEESNAGMLFPEKCIEAHLNEAKRNKAEIVFNTSIDYIKYDKDKKLYVLSSSDPNISEIKTNSLIISSGSWINHLLKNFNINLPITIDLNYVLYFKFKEEFNKLNSFFPVYLIAYNMENVLYGFPDINNGNGFKVSLYKQHLNFKSLEELNRTHKKEETLSFIKNLCSKFISGFSEEKIDYIKNLSCIYTSTPDGDFIIDYMPDHERVILVSACSGHGFKFTSRTGEHAVNLLDKKEETFDNFKISRFLN